MYVTLVLIECLWTSIPQLTTANKLMTSLYYDVITCSPNKKKECFSFCRKWSDFEGRCIRIHVAIINNHNLFDICDHQSCVACRTQIEVKCTIADRKYYNKVWLLLEYNYHYVKYSVVFRIAFLWSYIEFYNILKLYCIYRQ